MDMEPAVFPSTAVPGQLTFMYPPDEEPSSRIVVRKSDKELIDECAIPYGQRLITVDGKKKD